MHKGIIILIVLAVIIALGGYYFFSLSQINQPLVNQDRNSAFSQATDYDGISTGANANKDVAFISHTLEYSEFKGMTFEVPADWVEYGSDDLYDAKYDEGSSINFISPEITLHTVKAGMGGTPTEGIKTGARLSIGIQPANVASTIQNDIAYAKFQNDLAADCSNCVENAIITVDGKSAAFKVAKDVEGVIGGLAQAELYNEGVMFSIALRYGVDESYETYRHLFEDVLGSIDLN